MPEFVASVAELRTHVKAAKSRGATVGFVPTMGALHAGHARLLDVCRGECGFDVVSIFVNPLQFDRKQDLEEYPRPMDQDLRTCAEHGVDVVFAPSTSEMYPQEQLTFVEVAKVTEGLCGQFRPRHFRGVATVVAKLFNIVGPDRAYFGEKDAQQLAVIRRMAADMQFPITVVGVPTVREADGLALSSRNRHLSAEHRDAAPVLYRALEAARGRLRSGERSVGRIKARALEVLAAEPVVSLEYFDVVDADRLTPVETVDGPVLIAGAMWLGNTRLIDNVGWSPAEQA